MEIEFDPAKDEANLAKHGVSLAAASLLDILLIAADHRQNYGEDRLNAFGTIEGVPYVLSFTVRAEKIRAISLRRARTKEFRRHGL